MQIDAEKAFALSHVLEELPEWLPLAQYQSWYQLQKGIVSGVDKLRWMKGMTWQVGGKTHGVQKAD